MPIFDGGWRDAKDDTGSSVVFNQALDEIIRGQAWSLVTGLGVIYLILAVTFLSARIGLVALIPNVLPIAFYFGLLGWTGITLSPGTTVDEAERRLILATLEKLGGDKKQAAEVLGISLKTLYTRLSVYAASAHA